MEMLRNFLFEIAGCTSNFTVQNRQQTCISEIREKVDKSKVLVSRAEGLRSNPASSERRSGTSSARASWAWSLGGLLLPQRLRGASLPAEASHPAVPPLNSPVCPHPPSVKLKKFGLFMLVTVIADQV